MRRSTLLALWPSRCPNPVDWIKWVTLDIVDAMGRELGTISHGRFNPGFHEVSWNAKELNNGFYTYRLTVQASREEQFMSINS
jgi:hypothetical protein